MKSYEKGERDIETEIEMERAMIFVGTLSYRT